MLPRERRLTEARAFGQVFRHGRGAADSRLVVKARRLEDSDEVRAGVSVSKKIGKAHDRNRVKRRIREALRSFMPQLRPGVHLVVVAKDGAKDAAFSEIRASLEDLLRRNRLLC